MTSQISLFGGEEPLKINKKIRLIELFAGIGAQAKALENIGADFEHYRICEFDKYAVNSYNAIHGTDFPVSDITKWHAADLGIEQKDKYEYIATYSFPCFTADSLVLTDSGYKKIDEIIIGDLVLSHDNKYHKVINKFNNGEKEVFEIKGMAIDNIIATGNHKFYTRERYRKGHLGIRTFKEPVWKELKNLTKNDYLGMAINQNSEIPKWNGIDFEWSDGRKTRHKNELSALLDNGDFWWIIGRYVADGWHRKQGGIVISSGYAKTQEIESKLNKTFKYSKVEERTAAKYHIPLKELQKFTNEFGVCAINKKVAGFVFDLPIALLKSFLDGYMAGDGCFTQNKYKATTISRELALGIGQCIAKVYKRPFSIHKGNQSNTCVIEGRTVNQHIAYDIVWKENTGKQDKAFYENGYIWFPINSIKFRGVENVYDIEVERSHSFTVQNAIVHNCQSLSISGKQEGMEKGSGTRSGLLWEVERLLDECEELPQILLMENVDAILFEKNRKHFFQWCNRLEELGYKNYYEVLNARDYGIPQNRNRCFMVSVLGDYYYEFPKPIKLELCVKDLLESEVAEKYYISAERVKELLSRECDGRKGSLPDSNEPMISRALGSREHRYGGWSETCFALEARDYKDPKVAYIPNINPEHEVINMGKTVCEERTDEGLRFFKDGCIGAIRTIDGGGDKRVIEPQLKQVAQMYDNESNPQAGRIYDIDGISPAMDSCQGGNRMPKFAVKGELNCYNQYKPDGIQTSLNDGVYDSEGVGLSVTTSPFFMPSYLVKGEPELTEDGIKIRTNNSKGYDIAQDGDTINLERPNSKTRRGIVGKRVAQTLNTSTQQAVVIKDEVNVVGNYMKSGYDASRTINPEGIAPAVKENHGTVTAVVESKPELEKAGEQKTGKPMESYSYRIRKLTPRECLRLMGFKDIDFTKAKYKFDKESDSIWEIMGKDILESDKVKQVEEMGIKVSERTSNSQCYKQAGNSIVVDVLEAIFRNMNIKGVKRWQE